jgi:putative redox protein
LPVESADLMTNAQVIWRDRMTFTASAKSGFAVPLGSDPAVGGDDDGFRPMELLAVGLTRLNQ